MRFERLRIENLRAFSGVELAPAPGWNLFVGANGAGKTTLLEAAYLLSHGRSFRSGSRDSLTRRGAEGFSVFGGLEYGGGGVAKTGLSRSGGRYEARIDGVAGPVSALLEHVAVVCFEPGSHELIAGAALARRRYLDWTVFHVEHRFLETWRRFHRALEQRNALLKRAAEARELDAWDAELAEAGEGVTLLRRAAMDRLAPRIAERCKVLLPELGQAEIRFDPGWNEEASLGEQLLMSRSEDLRRGFSGAGPHRADWSMAFELAPRREHLSRGQEKLCALAATLGQAELYATDRGEWPIVCVDDLASELDEPHQLSLLRALPADAQVLVTGTHIPSGLTAAGIHPAMFHVEPAQIVPLL